MKRSWELILSLAITAWAVMCVYCLTRPVPKDEYIPEVVALPEIVEVYEAPEPVSEVPEDSEPEPDLTKLNQIENATLTHYCICKSCCGKDESHPAYGITASGRKAEPHVSVAVDPLLIPLGSTVYIDYGDGELQEYRADDTGSAVAGAKIDLCVTSHQEALELGRKVVRVYWEEQ